MQSLLIGQIFTLNKSRQKCIFYSFVRKLKELSIQKWWCTIYNETLKKALSDLHCLSLLLNFFLDALEKWLVFFLAYWKQCRNDQNQTLFKSLNRRYLPHFWSGYSFKGYAVVNLRLPSWHGGSLGWNYVGSSFNSKLSLLVLSKA